MKSFPVCTSAETTLRSAMAITVTSIYEEALSLSGDSRVALAERLIESVSPDPKILEDQLASASRRVAILKLSSA